MELEIKHNTALHRFEADIDGKIAFIEYSLFPDGIIFSHTEVPPELEGQGIASQLAKYVLEYARGEKLKVVPLCPYVNAYVKRHPEYNDLTHGF